MLKDYYGFISLIIILLIIMLLPLATVPLSSCKCNEHFENISPSQKNLLVVVLYGILIILISDLIIKEKDE